MIATAHRDTFALDNLPPAALRPKLMFEPPTPRYAGRLNIGADLLDAQVAAGHGARTALRADGLSCTYEALLAQANRIAQVLVRDLGLIPGNRVLLRGPNNPMMVACWLAVAKAGGIIVATMPLLRAKELTDVITKAEVSHALCDRRLDAELKAALPSCPTLKTVAYWYDDAPDGLDRLAERRPAAFENVNTAAEDIALIAFTSGTTGKPKGAMHTHRDLAAVSDLFPRSCVGMHADDIVCGTPPLAFTYGLGGLLLFPLRIGASAVLVEKMTPEVLLDTMHRHRVSVCFSAPTMYRALAPLIAGGGRAASLPALRACVSAGEALPDATRQQFRAASGLEIIDGIGSTELGHIFISHTPARVRRGATGYAIPGYRATVLDEAGAPCPPETVGRLAVLGPTGCKYLADARQRDYVLAEGPMRGWNVTGDAYRMDADGYFFYQARTDDMIVSAGYNIAAPEVEGALMTHDAVAECAVVGWPDEARGMIVKAFVVVKPGTTRDAGTVARLQEHVKQSIAPYKYPRAVEFLDALPRTETGKLQRYRLKKQ